MNQTTAVNVWKGTNRITRLWEDLLANRVSPDPVVFESATSREGEIQIIGSEPDKSTGLGLLEKAGFESLRILKQALEILSAPPEEAAANALGEQDVQDSPAGYLELEGGSVHSPLPVDPDLVLTFIKVPREPDPQPGSAIDTRCMAYGLKIPMKPLHKRPIHQRLFFCLRQAFAGGRDESLKRNSW